MDTPGQDRKYGALVPAGERIDHPDEDAVQRRLRELGAAFNRMSSNSDAEAESAFQRARSIVREMGISFDAILKSSRETEVLQGANQNLARQLKQVMGENAKFRAMHAPYKIRATLNQFGHSMMRWLVLASPILLTSLLFETGYVNASVAGILLLMIGFFHVVRAFIAGSGQQVLLATLIVFAGIITISIAGDKDTPVVHRREAALVENMNRDHELGPKTLDIDYPISHRTLVTTVLGIKDVLKVTVEGYPAPIEITCAKYYDNSIIVRRSVVDATKPPEMPDIFHSTPVGTFGACDLYARLASFH